ncbi:hypothetical protein PMI29_02861 [Pseudomonas sp. GM49]|nr:hypothetical protein PMI29_02861 [Pseudomonas sp. GM49]
MMYAKAGIIRPLGGDAREISFDCSGLIAGKPAPTEFSGVPGIRVWRRSLVGAGLLAKRPQQTTSIHRPNKNGSLNGLPLCLQRTEHSSQA